MLDTDTHYRYWQKSRLGIRYKPIYIDNLVEYVLCVIGIGIYEVPPLSLSPSLSLYKAKILTSFRGTRQLIVN